MTNPQNHFPERIEKILRDGFLTQLSYESLLDLSEIELFDFYINETEAVLENILKTEKAYIAQQISDGDPEPNDSGMVAFDYQSKRVRYSHIIYLTSLLESCLQRACDRLKIILGENAVPFGLSELKGDQWSKCYKFLERYGHFDLPKPLLSELKALTSIRNYLVHNNGDTAALLPKDREEFQKCPGIVVSGLEFEIEPTYIRHGLSLVKQLVEYLEDHLRKKILMAKSTLNQS